LLGLTSNGSSLVIISSIFSQKRSLMILPPLLYLLFKITMKSPTMKLLLHSS
jgi:hypothetical protein